MAQILLHGTLHASIFEAESLSNPHRASGSAPKFIRKVTCSGSPFPLHFL
jgi:phospholipase D1/2